ncbi:MAG TPA: class I SAM-dependent methyltransferase [Ktedonobacteraceae bacterium]|nr:class I SAM-dependent methyltransferase [Ktedonobacteraceae bacterium]
MNETAPSANQWSENDSSIFLDLADIFVPAREEQVRSLLQLIPAEADENFTVVELASGGGKLIEAVLEHFPHCHAIALDGSEAMRAHTQQRLARFGSRLEIRPFELSEYTWRNELPDRVRCVLSSLCVHHLDGSGKRQLFRDMLKHLEPGGALLLADIILPADPHIARFFAQQYDDLVREQSLASRGDLSGYEEFEKQKWNYFRYDYGKPDLYDQPSLLYEQLRWLQEVNFRQVDCYWMRAGHAIYGGYK